MATTGDQTDALQREKRIVRSNKPGARPRPKKMTIAKFEKMLRK